MKNNNKTIEKLLEKIAKLEKYKIEHKQTKDRIQHLNLILRTIRNVNQLIVREKNSGVLIQRICEILIDKRGYSNAWIVLLGKKREYLKSAEAGLGKDYIPMEEMMKKGKLTDCGIKTLEKKDIIITEVPAKECLDCLLSTSYSGWAGYTICIRQNNIIYGLLAVSASKQYIKDKEEQDLFREVAEDIGLALHSIALDEERKQAEEKLISRNKELESWNDVSVGRELKMLELKKEINGLLEKSGEKPKYKIPI